MNRDDRSKRLVKYGFIEDGARHKYEYDEEQEIYVPKEGEYEPEDAYEERHEQAAVMPRFFGVNDYQRTGYPYTPKKFRLQFKSPGASLEETYYWLLDNYRMDWGYPEFDKITDVFSASEQSSFWGQAQTRMGRQQDKAQQYMATIGKMVKDLFQLVRELRILDERLEMYEKAPESKSADVSLKGLYVDMVEGGSKNPSSVYGIAQQVGFTSLPDLFFNTHVHDADKIDDVVERMDFNDQVLNVLRRKLFSFLNWKDKTEDELKNRRQFTLRYLRQHWGTIQMYMNWVKPYLKNVARMQMSEEHHGDAKIISSFETSITEIEVLAKKPPVKGFHPCVLISIVYTTQPQMDYSQEGYQHKGPLHVGEVEFHMRGYAWTPEDVQRFKRYKREEDMELIKLIDESVSSAMDALGEDLHKFLREADEELEADEEEEEEEPAMSDALKPLTNILSGLQELFSGVRFPGGGDGEVTNAERERVYKEHTKVNVHQYQMYKNYKKAHDMVAW